MSRIPEVSRIHGREEAGASLVELLIAMILLSIVIMAVDASVTMVNSRATSLSGSTQSIDQLQIAEETMTRDVRAATVWTTSPMANASTLKTALAANTAVTSIAVNSLGQAVQKGDTIVVGATTPDTFVASAATAASAGSTTISVVSHAPTLAHPTNDTVYDSANVSLHFAAALDGTSLTTALAAGASVSTLSINPLIDAVHSGDNILVGQGSTTEFFVASANAAVGATSISVTGRNATYGHAIGEPVYDSNITIAFTANTDTSKTLTITVNGTTGITLINLDPSTGLIVPTTSWTSSGGVSQGPFYTTVTESMTMDLPRVSAPRPTKTTVSAPTVIANNVDYVCKAKWKALPGTGTQPC